MRPFRTEGESPTYTVSSGRRWIVIKNLPSDVTLRDWYELRSLVILKGSPCG